LNALDDPGSLPDLSLREWDALLPMVRRSRLQGRLAVAAEENGILDQLPPSVGWHLRSYRILADKHERAMRWELSRIDEALHGLGGPIVLLKGAAYVAADLPPARGRLYSDLDILVPKQALRSVEHALLLRGWIPMKLHPYDQRYYRRWMHELPPLQHRRRQTVLDVHHTILPETARARPNPSRLIEASRAVSPSGLFRVFSPADMVLHSATHLFYEGEFDSGLRDLYDLRDLATLFGRQSDFWGQLVPRAVEMQLTRPLFYALRYLRMLLGVSIPEPCRSELESLGPRPPQRQLMDSLFIRGLLPGRAGTIGSSGRWARELLYIRGHYLRMPLRLLLPHLLHKTFRGKPE
jgi:hypothetical protein